VVNTNFSHLIGERERGEEPGTQVVHSIRRSTTSPSLLRDWCMGTRVGKKKELKAKNKCILHCAIWITRYQ
jgi:hypothetical protein